MEEYSNVLEPNKPNSIFNVIPKDWYLKQTFEEDYLDSGNCYEWYYAIGDYYKPKSILEIGVLFGYSAGALILGAKDTIKRFDGYDIDVYFRDSFKKDSQGDSINVEGEIEYKDWSSNKIAYYKLHDLIERNFSDPHQVYLNIMVKDSLHLQYILEYYDIIHIDGGHTYDCKVHDLNLTLGRCGVVIVDDYDFIPHVKQATDEFIAKNKKYILNTNHISSFRGTMIIEYKNAY